MTPDKTFAPLTEEKWPDELGDMKDTFATKLNIYRTMAHHPNLLRAWANLRDHVVVNSALKQQQSEVVILRVGINLEADYEWKHHVSRARACGMSDLRISSIRYHIEEMTNEDAIFAKSVDELMDQKRMLPSTLESVIALVGKKGVLDIIATVGFYSTLGFMLNSFNTPLDDNIVAEMIDQPFN